jgi:hypothetical protein
MLFRRGHPEPAAEQTLAPLVTAALAAEHGTPPPHSFACRTWVCQLSVETGRQVQPTPDAFLRPRFEDRVQSAGHGRHRRDRNPATGELVYIRIDTLVLRHPSGAPRTPDELRRERAQQPLPPSQAECESTRARLATQMDRLQAQDLSLNAPYTLFKRGQPNPALAATTTERLSKALQLEPRPSDPVVECRGNACKVLLQEPSLGSLMRRAPEGYQLSVSSAVRPATGQDVWLVPMPLAQQNSRALLATLFRQIGEGKLQCPQSPTARGALSVILDVDGSEGNGPPVVRASYEGSLAGTPASRCLAALVDRAIAASKPQGPFAPFWKSSTFLFPPPTADEQAWR